MANDELIVDDENIEEMGKYIILKGAKIEKYLKEYNEQIKNICSDGISSGEVHDGLVEFQKYIEGLIGQVDTAVRAINIHLTNFDEEIDEKDQYIF